MVRRDDKVQRVRTARNAADHGGNLLHGLAAGGKDFVLGVGLVAARVNLIMIDVHDLLAGKNRPQVVFFHGFQVVKLDAPTLRHALLQHGLPLRQVLAGHIVIQHLIIRCHLHPRVGQQRGHTQPRVGRQHAQPGRQLHSRLRVLGQQGGKLRAHFIAHSVGDNHHGAFLVACHTL